MKPLLLDGRLLLCLAGRGSLGPRAAIGELPAGVLQVSATNHWNFSSSAAWSMIMSCDTRSRSSSVLMHLRVSSITPV
jgi:hypothetical protein